MTAGQMFRLKLFLGYISTVILWLLFSWFLFLHLSFTLASETSSLVAIGICLVCLWAIWSPDAPWSPWWKSSKDVARLAQKLGKITKKDLLYELGSGDGEVLITLAEEFGIRSVGIEFDTIRVWFSQWRAKHNHVSDKVTVLKRNFFEIDISPATVVYFYMLPTALRKLEKKLFTELKPGTRVISYRYEIPYLRQVAFDKDYILYVYEIPKKPIGKK